ncbi:DUF1223 domain-containing protein [Sphingomonas donggukensis]|uniref:DUF1223 domain-containing protein n=1 Tax=Sphingomonas donggukensis TaxID=2949093 RepID=A0ABY4TVB7_9SPHN|nr:DUF1223 domain-containing protein [Sphingomonas donggukensis]URW76331.1 DUF1223 domain-containing protein [Sphingomonas donggukensis]
MILVLGSVTVASALNVPASAADRANPTVVELFTAQGCAACPPAQAAVNALAGRDDLIVLTFAVTYWDSLGWRDRFAQPAFTARQRAYAQVGKRQLATPQVVLNGRFAVVGNDRDVLMRAIDSADRGDRGPAIAVVDGWLTVAADARSARRADVWLVSYDPRTIAVPVRAGENAGRTLPHRNVVRRLDRIGAWSGTAIRYPLPPPRGGLRRAVLVQSADGGAIVAARVVE